MAQESTIDAASILTKVNDNIWDIPMTYKSGMRVPGRVFVSEKLLLGLERETLEQISNVATLPGIQKYSMAMPDAHSGYGFPIGGVAAFDRDTGIISPGGVGYDINCGVSVLRSDLSFSEIQLPMVKLMNQIQRDVPSGVGQGGE